MKKASVCIDARMYNHSGIGRYLQMLLPGICTHFETTLLGDPDLLAPLSGLAAIVSFKSPIYSVSEQRQYRKMVGKTDLFWSPHYNAPLMGINSTTRVVTIHDVFHLAFRQELSAKQRLYVKVVIGNAVRSADAIITVSEFSKSEIIKHTGCHARKISVIYNGAEAGRSLKTNHPGVTTGKYHLPDKYILFVGNVKPHKNLKTLLKAYLLLPEGLRSAHKVVIVGKKEGFITGDSKLTAWVNDEEALKNNVVFTGYVDDCDMNGIYSKAELLVFPSVYEGFGLPPLEAMANGCPVIASDSSSIPEVCGPAAAYFSPMDENALCRGMEEILTNNLMRDEYIKKGFDRIKLFSWQNAVQKHVGLFNQLLY